MLDTYSETLNHSRLRQLICFGYSHITFSFNFNIQITKFMNKFNWIKLIDPFFKLFKSQMFQIAYPTLWHLLCNLSEIRQNWRPFADKCDSAIKNIFRFRHFTVITQWFPIRWMFLEAILRSAVGTKFIYKNYLLLVA